MNIKRSAALIMIAVLLLCGLSGCKDGQGFDSDTPSVAIIIKGSESDFWNDVKKGSISISLSRDRITRRTTKPRTK